MNELFEFMGNHPILTFFIVWFIADAIGSFSFVKYETKCDCKDKEED